MDRTSQSDPTTVDPESEDPIWIGWGHLMAPIDDLAQVDPLGALDLDQVDGPGLALLERLRYYVPEVLSVRAVGVRVHQQTFTEALEAAADTVDFDQGFRVQRRILEVIDAGNKAGRFDIEIPWIPAPLPPPPPSPFLHTNFERLHEQGPLLAAYCKSLRSSLKLTPAGWWGRVFFSATYFGGLLRPDSLLAIPAALGDEHDADIRWLDLKTESGSVARAASTQAVGTDGQGSSQATATLEASPQAEVASPAWGASTDPSGVDHDARTNPSEHAPAAVVDDVGDLGEFMLQRWLPDPLTRLLLVRGLKEVLPPADFAPRDNRRRVMGSLRAYAKAAGFANLVPPNFGAIALGAKTRMHLHLPAYLVEYLAGRQRSASLSPAAWTRLLVPPKQAVDTLAELPIAPEPSTPDESDAVDTKEIAEPDDEVEWAKHLRELGRIIRRGGPGLRMKVRTWRVSNKAVLLPSIALLAEWIDEWLLGRPKGHSPASPKSIYEHLNRAGKRLVGLLGDQNPTIDFDEDGYIELYESALENTPPSRMRRTASSLRQFHEFLQARHDAPDIDSSTILIARGRYVPRVDANLVCIDTFYLAMRKLEELVNARGRDSTATEHGLPPSVSAVADMLRQIASLGFFGGLRRSEAIGLTLGDLRGTDHLVLTVSPNGLRGLKTRNSCRIVPVSALFPADECARLIAWRDKRLVETKGDLSAPLFPIFWHGNSVRTGDWRLEFITNALKLAANDPTLRFHHLRHSFASWTALRLWIGEQSGREEAIPDWLLPTEASRERWRASAEMRRRLLGTAPTNRRALMQISRLLGHSSVEITLGSYVHVMDLLAGLTIARLAPRLDIPTLQALSGLGSTAMNSALSSPQLPNNSIMVGDKVAPDQHMLAEPGAVIAAVLAHVLRGRKSQIPVVLTPRPDLAPTSPSVPPTKPLPLLLYVERALRQVEASEANLSQVAATTGLSETDLHRWWESLNQVRAAANIPARTAGKSSTDILEPPQTRGQLALATKTLQAIERIESAGDGHGCKPPLAKVRIRAVLNDFLKRWEPGTPLTVQMRDVAAAKRWIWFLKTAELALSVRGKLTPARGNAVPSPARQLKHWTSALGKSVAWAPLGTRRILASKRLAKASDRGTAGSRGAVTLRVDRCDMALGKRTALSGNDLVGVRFALAMKLITEPELLRIAQGNNSNCEGVRPEPRGSGLAGT